MPTTCRGAIDPASHTDRIPALTKPEVFGENIYF